MMANKGSAEKRVNLACLMAAETASNNGAFFEGWSERQIVGHLSLPQRTIKRWVRHNFGLLSLNTVHIMDCVQGMARLPHDFIDLVFADPPYNIGISYGNGTAFIDRHNVY